MLVGIVIIMDNPVGRKDPWKLILCPKTKIFISEQKFHVSKYTFNTIVEKMENIGFEICKRPKIFLSRTVIMKIKNTNSPI